MPIKPLTSQVFRSTLPSGQPNAQGTVGVYVAGTSFATLATVWSDAVKTSELDNPVTLSDNGEKEIWFEVDVDMIVKDSGNNQLPGDAGEILAVPADTTPVQSGTYNLVTNPSAEIDTDSDTLPDNWTLDLETSGTITTSTTSVAHGEKSFKFTGAGNGAGTATSLKYDILENRAVDVEFTYQTDAPTSTNSVKIKWYTKADAVVTTTTVYSGTTGQPSTFTTYYRSVAAPATATKAEVILGGIENGGTVETGITYFDGLIVSQGRDVNPILYDENGNEVATTTSTPNATTYINFTNNSTGLNPKIDVGGEDVGVDIEGVTVKNGDITTTGDISAADITVTTATINSGTAYGHVTLDTPELISLGTLQTTATAVNVATLNTAGAKKADLSIYLAPTSATGATMYFASSTFTPGNAYVKAHASDIGASDAATCINDFTVNLDGNNDFWYASSTATVLAVRLYLVGYYV